MSGYKLIDIGKNTSQVKLMILFFYMINDIKNLRILYPLYVLSKIKLF